QRFGLELDQIVQERLIEEAYREAVDTTEITPAGAASVSNVQYAPGERLTGQNGLSDYDEGFTCFLYAVEGGAG
ncbi:MAG: hypothetical protein P8Y07_14260, partial [Gemmatimonadales bacterium]